jgi:hypothetical protein
MQKRLFFIFIICTFIFVMHDLSVAAEKTKLENAPSNQIGRFQLVPGKSSSTLTGGGITSVTQHEAYLLDTMTGSLFVCSDRMDDKYVQHRTCSQFTYLPVGNNVVDVIDKPK